MTTSNDSQPFAGIVFVTSTPSDQPNINHGTITSGLVNSFFAIPTAPAGCQPAKEVVPFVAMSDTSAEQKLTLEVERLTKLVAAMELRELDLAFASAGYHAMQATEYVVPQPQQQPVALSGKPPIPLRALTHRMQQIGLCVPFSG